MPVVEFIGKFIVREGPQYNPGERAFLEDEQAADAIRQGSARLIDNAVTTPTSHKQIKNPPVAK